ncbi:hypothetical protein D0T25_23745 [Duganella sp. BJB488]|nr:hypothetical protein D0T25_23745 [Duganella sp. BJB488]
MSQQVCGTTNTSGVCVGWPLAAGAGTITALVAAAPFGEVGLGRQGRGVEGGVRQVVGIGHQRNQGVEQRCHLLRVLAPGVYAQADFVAQHAAVPVDRRFGVHVLGQRVERQRFEREREWVERRVPGLILAFRVQRGADQAQRVLPRDQVTHLLLGDTQYHLLPGAHAVAKRLGHLRAAKRICGVQILHDQTVFDFCVDRQQASDVVAWRKFQVQRRCPGRLGAGRRRDRAAQQLRRGRRQALFGAGAGQGAEGEPRGGGFRQLAFLVLLMSDIPWGCVAIDVGTSETRFSWRRRRQMTIA